MSKQGDYKETFKTPIEWLQSKLSEFETIQYSLPNGLYEYISIAKEKENNFYLKNNDWIEIITQNDLPKENTDCFILYKDGSVSIDLFLITTNQFRSNSWKYITHYQKIYKPELPIKK